MRQSANRWLTYVALLSMVASASVRAQEDLAPLPVVSAGCDVSTELEGTDEYYPPGSIRRAEAGEVVIELIATPGVGHGQDVQVVRTSDFPDLDRAAVRIGNKLKVTNPCAEQRVRLAIHFDQWRDGPDRQVGCVIFSASTNTVLVVRYETASD